VKQLTLWKYNPITGYWVSERNVLPATADQWLAIFERDEPEATFRVASRKPTHNPHKEK